MAEPLKICFIGTASSGKTALLNRITTGAFSTDLPQRIEDCEIGLTVDGQNYNVALADTLASDDRSRRLAYMETNVFLICFAYNNPASLNQVSTWVKDLTITHHTASPTPYFLVGTCNDLPPQVTEAEVKAMKEKHPEKITQLFSVSSKDGTGVQELWSATTEAAVKNRKGAQEIAANKANDASTSSGISNTNSGGGRKPKGGRSGCAIL